jgi:hypothetical protein
MFKPYFCILTVLRQLFKKIEISLHATRRGGGGTEQGLKSAKKCHLLFKCPFQRAKLKHFQYTVKLSYNELGYNEHSVKHNNLFGRFMSFLTAAMLS